MAPERARFARVSKSTATPNMRAVETGLVSCPAPESYTTCYVAPARICGGPVGEGGTPDWRDVESRTRFAWVFDPVRGLFRVNHPHSNQPTIAGPAGPALNSHSRLPMLDEAARPVGPHHPKH